MDIDAFLNEIRSSPAYRDQVVHVHETPAREAQYAPPDAAGLTEGTAAALGRLGFDRLYTHQAEGIRAVLDGRDIVVASGTASGKSLCYVAPILEMIRSDPNGKALLLFPTKALCQDQFRAFRVALDAAGMGHVLAGVFDGDTPSASRRKLRDHATAIFSNPDMVHAALMPQHTRWAAFLANLRYLVLDELHVYNGIFGANMANLMRRFELLCGRYGGEPRIVACSATIANPEELARRVTGRDMTVVASDGSPRGRRVYLFWNPPVT
ncbi:MAG: DEAD/DEAH box helicase, partial [Planctomycetota bacterium]